MKTTDHDLLTREEAATILRTSERTLLRLEKRGAAPPHRRVGAAVRYSRREIDEWLADTASPCPADSETQTNDAGDTDLLAPRSVAEILGVSESVLAYWRGCGSGPPFARLTKMVVRYRRGDVHRWIEARFAETRKRRRSGG